MGNLETTPVDELTNIPLLFVPHWQVGTLMRSASKSGRFSDWNHAFFPRQSPELKGLAGLAVRYARVQRVSRLEHERYHQTYDGPPLPQTDEEKFRASVLCAAGYIPPVALNMGHRKPREEFLGIRQIQRLRTSGEVRVDRPARVKRFITRYVLDQEIEGVDGKFVSDFLTIRPSSDYDRKRQADMARTLLSMTVRGVAAELQSGYSFGYENELLSPDAPPEVGDFIVDEVAGDNIYAMRPLIDELQDKLIGQSLGGLALEVAV
jgi:hypothetical protein